MADETFELTDEQKAYAKAPYNAEDEPEVQDDASEQDDAAQQSSDDAETSETSDEADDSQADQSSADESEPEESSTPDDDPEEWVSEAQELGLSEDEAKSLGSRSAYDAFFRLHAKRMAATSEPAPAPHDVTKSDETETKGGDGKDDQKPSGIEEFINSINLDEYDDATRKDMEGLVNALRYQDGKINELVGKLNEVPQQQGPSPEQVAFVERFHAAADNLNPDVFGSMEGDHSQLTPQQQEARMKLGVMMDSIAENHQKAGLNVPGEKTLMRLAYESAWSDQIASAASEKRAKTLESQSRKRQTAGSQARRSAPAKKINPLDLGSTDDHPKLKELFQNLQNES